MDKREQIFQYITNSMNAEGCTADEVLKNGKRYVGKWPTARNFVVSAVKFLNAELGNDYEKKEDSVRDDDYGGSYFWKIIRKSEDRLQPKPCLLARILGEKKEDYYIATISENLINFPLVIDFSNASKEEIDLLEEWDEIRCQYVPSPEVSMIDTDWGRDRLEHPKHKLVLNR